MSNKGTAVLLAAAGLSSRMGHFKPMAALGDRPLIDHALKTFVTVDIRKTVVVTGYRHDEIKGHLKGRGIDTAVNDRYAVTDMFESVRLGLSRLEGKCSRVFVMPADIPLVRPFSIETMLLCAKQQKSDVIKPSYRGKGGHPVLIDGEMIPYILRYRGEGGLKGALSSAGAKTYTLPLPDPGILMDADTPAHLSAIRRYYRDMDTPSRELALEILACRDVGEEITRHSIEVEKLAVLLARRAQSSGFSLDLPRVEAGALLHDVERRRGRDHAEAGYALLNKMGYDRIADIVGAHMELPAGALEKLDERAIVYLADKLTCGQARVTVQSRLDWAMQRFGGNEEAANAIRKRMADARAIMRRLGLEETDCLRWGSV